MHYEHIGSMATDWSVVNYYKLPENRKFKVEWSYIEEKYNFHATPFICNRIQVVVKQTACYAVVTTRRSDGTFFNFDVLDEDMVTIRGKHCKGNAIYLQIYNELLGR